MPEGSQEKSTEHDLIMGATLDLSPQTVREHLMTLHFRQEAANKEQHYLKDSIKELKAARVREFKCPFNPETGGNGHALLDEVRRVTQEVSALTGIREEVDELKQKADQFEGALGLIKWVGFSSAAGIFLMLIRVFILGQFPIK